MQSCILAWYLKKVKGNNVNSNDRYAQFALDINAETGWEPYPSEVRQNEEFQASMDVDVWLRTGRTDQFNWNRF